MAVKDMNDKRQAEFHTFGTRAMFLCRRAIPDIEPSVSYLSTTTRSPNESDLNVLLKTMGF